MVKEVNVLSYLQIVDVLQEVMIFLDGVIFLDGYTHLKNDQLQKNCIHFIDEDLNHRG